MGWMFHTEACRDTLAPKWRVERHLDTGRVSGARGFCSLWERLYEPWDTFGHVFPSLRCPGAQVSRWELGMVQKSAHIASNYP